MSQLTVAGGGLRGRIAKKSDDYVSQILARREKGTGLTHEAKVRKMALILQDESTASSVSVWEWSARSS
jgi:hypothetical protein